MTALRGELPVDALKRITGDVVTVLIARHGRRGMRRCRIGFLIRCGNRRRNGTEQRGIRFQLRNLRRNQQMRLFLLTQLHLKHTEIIRETNLRQCYGTAAAEPRRQPDTVFRFTRRSHGKTDRQRIGQKLCFPQLFPVAVFPLELPARQFGFIGLWRQRIRLRIQHLKMRIRMKIQPEKRHRQDCILFQLYDRRDLLMLACGIRQLQRQRQLPAHQQRHDHGNQRHKNQKAEHHHADAAVHVQHENQRDNERANIPCRHFSDSIGTGTAASTSATTLRASPCCALPFGERIRRCASTLSAISLTSSGSV